MKNKILKLTSILIVTIYLISCTNENMNFESSKTLDETNERLDTTITDISIEEDANNNVSIQKSKDTGENGEDKQKKIGDVNNAGYEIVDDIYIEEGDSENISIKFPQITGLIDGDKQKGINALLKAEALKVLSYYNDDDFKEQYLDLDVKYSISLSNQYILSVQYFGLGELEMAPRPHKLFYTINIDLSIGKKLRLVDFVNVNEEFLNMILNAEFKPIAAPDDIFVLKEHDTYDQTQAGLINADSMDDLNRVFSFFTDESLVISIPALHALGGSAELEIKYHDLTEYLSESSGGWKDFLENFDDVK